MTNIKVFVTGVFNSGKTTFLRANPNYGLIMTEEYFNIQSPIGLYTQLEYSNLILHDGRIINLFANLSAMSYQQVWHLFHDQFDGVIILIDTKTILTHKFAGDSIAEDTERMIQFFKQEAPKKLLLVANKIDHFVGQENEALKRLRDILNFNDNEVLNRGVATEPVSVKEIVMQLISVIE